MPGLTASRVHLQYMWQVLMPVKSNPEGPAGKHFVELVRSRRESLGMTKTGLSRRLAEFGRAMSIDVITKIEQGIRPVDVDDLVALVTALDMPRDFEVLTGAAACTRCSGRPPEGFTCNECGSGQVHSEPAEGPIDGLLSMEQLNAIAQALAKRKRS